MDPGRSTAVTCPSHQQPLTLSQSGCILETTTDSQPATSPGPGPDPKKSSRPAAVQTSRQCTASVDQLSVDAVQTGHGADSPFPSQSWRFRPRWPGLRLPAPAVRDGAAVDPEVRLTQGASKTAAPWEPRPHRAASRPATKQTLQAPPAAARPSPTKVRIPSQRSVNSRSL